MTVISVLEMADGEEVPGDLDDGAEAHNVDSHTSVSDSGGRPEDTGAPDGMIGLLKWQSLLLQFVHPQVRNDFLSGFFDIEASESMLSDLDLIRTVLIPPWRGSSITTLKSQLEMSRNLAMSLLVESTDIFDVGDRLWSFNEWSKYLTKLSNATYWKFKPPSSIAIRYLSVKTRVSESPAIGSVNVKPEGEHSIEAASVRPENGMRTSSPNVLQSVRPKIKITPTDISLSTKIVKKAPFEEIKLSSSSSESTESNTDESSEHVTVHHQARRRRKEPVKPLIFNSETGRSIRSFLNSFEKYFYLKFEGNARDCSQELGNFLTGEILHYYDALGGRKLRFPDMKNKLLVWSKSRHIGGTSRWREKLSDATMEVGESLRLYGTRIQELGQRAYPHEERIRLKEMRRHFLKTVPADFSRRVFEAENILMLMDNGRKMTWTEMLNMADRQLPAVKVECDESESPHVWFSRDETKSSTREYQKSLSPPPPSRNQRVFRSNEKPWLTKRNTRDVKKTSSPPASYRNARASLLCDWCGRRRHSTEDCWERQGVCVVCGDSDHQRADCPKFRLHQLQLVCPKCSGSHAGKNCDVASNC